jgi:hypothetical protein
MRLRDQPPLKLVAAALVVAAGLAGLGIVAAEVNSWWIVVGALVFAAAATFPAVGRRVLQLACAAAVALLALVAVAALVRIVRNLVGLEDERVPIPVGLVLALLVFGAVAFWYLHGDWPHARPRGGHRADDPRRFEIPSPRWSIGWAAGVAAALAVGVILVGPLALALLGEDEDEVTEPEPVVSRIDALIVSDDPRASARAPAAQVPAPYADSTGFEVTYSVGFAEGEAVRWTLTGATEPEQVIAALTDPDAPRLAAPAPVHDADRVLLLLVDGTPPVIADPAAVANLPGEPGEVRRWRRIAKAAALGGTPTYPLLAASRARRDDWRNFIVRGTHVRRGEVLRIREFTRSSMPDAAVQLAIASPGAQEDFGLALRHQPILRFHRTEPVPRPLSVETLFRDGKVRQCFSGRVGGDRCAVVERARELENGDTHLELALPKGRNLRTLAREEERRVESATAEQDVDADTLAPPPAAPPGGGARPLGEGSAIYVHPVPTESEDVSTLYLDYWWYLPDNPAGSGGGAFCGPGLLMPGISCFDHQSDWEGVTVVLDRTRPGRTPEPVAVHYAQHGDVVRYEWETLRAAWKRNATTRRLLDETPGSAERPLVFIARGTHAAYPLPCPQARPCKQVAHDIDEKPHDGGRAWVGNSVACGESTCLRQLPTALGGRAPALWNAFEGVWGVRNCFMTYYCDSTSPPAAPGQQGRYEAPWDNDGTFDPRAPAGPK